MRNKLFDTFIPYESQQTAGALLGNNNNKNNNTFPYQKRYRTLHDGLAQTEQRNISYLLERVSPFLRATLIQPSILIPIYLVSIFTSPSIRDPIYYGNNVLYHIHQELSTHSLKNTLFNCFLTILPTVFIHVYNVNMDIVL